jgi:hypothetical protein
MTNYYEQRETTVNFSSILINVQKLLIMFVMAKIDPFNILPIFYSILTASNQMLYTCLGRHPK